MKTNITQLLKTGLIAGIISTAVNSLIFFIFKAAGIFTDTIFIKPEQPLTVVPVIISSLLPSILGSVLLYFLLRYTKNGMRLFIIITAALTVLSFLNPFLGIPNVTVAYAVCLNLMHLVVPGVLIFMQQRALAKTN